MAQENLFELHALDLRVADLKRQGEEQKARITNFRQSAALRQRERDELRQRCKDLHLEVKRTELEIEGAREKVKSLEAKMLRVVHARELDALSREIHSSLEGIDSKESCLLELYDQTDKIERDLATREEELKRREQELARLVADVDENVRALAAEVSQSQASRGELASHVEPSVLAKYEKARGRMEGSVLFSVLENSCEGCGLPVPGYEWNRLRQNPGNVYECSNCGRLLMYVGEP